MRKSVLLLLLGLGACTTFSLVDPYGNVYGGWYNHGGAYRWQLDTCEQEVSQGAVPNPGRKLYMRCCMWRHGVPIDDPESCGPAKG